MTKNLLDLETSPYLLQHQDNPVHWWPWGPDAFDYAEKYNKPVLLSVGYAACHWCHVMAHESFEDDDTAQLMNELFVNIKVDREERPDIDRIYMTALHETGEQGGWPLTMFLTPQGAPFWGGTYFPKTAQYGRPGFSTVLREIARIFRDEHDKVVHNSEALRQALNSVRQFDETGELSAELLDGIAERILQLIDMEHGGLQGAPKFPQTALFELLWRAAQRRGDERFTNAVTKTLTHIAQGGIYDHLGGGFARYSVDALWLAPHFEKMLYDNAQLISLMTEVWKHTHDPLLAERTAETAEWVLREMIAESGAFSASLDADSEGEEGKFYVWQKSEIDALLDGGTADLFSHIYGIVDGGNWEGTNIPNRLDSLTHLSEAEERKLAEAREVLFRHRAERIHPGLDDKVLTDWNGLMISALANAACVFEQPAWLAAAQTAFDVICAQLHDADQLMHSLRLGKARHHATADGYANMIAATLALYEATREARYLDRAVAWTGEMNEGYLDRERGGYFFTSSHGEKLITRSRSAGDDAVPNANGTMIANLVRLHVFTGDASWRTQVDALISAFKGEVLANVFPHATFFNGLDFLMRPDQCVLIGNPANTDTCDLRNAVWQSPLINRILVELKPEDDLPTDHPAAGKGLKDDRATLYFCRGTSCSLPVTSAEEFTRLIT